MRTVTFQSVLEGAARLLGMNPAQDLNAAAASRLTAYIQPRYEEALAFEWWPELTPIELRQYRASYLSTNTYAAPTLSMSVEVFDPGSGVYYQTLRAVPITQPPASYSLGTWTVNDAYWAVAASSYRGETYAAGDFAAGDIRRNPLNNRYYQCHTAHTGTATLDTTKFGVLTPFVRYIAFDQLDENGIALTPLGEARATHQNDPRLDRERSGRLPHGTETRGVLVHPDMGVLTWLEFRIRPAVWNATVWSAGTYAAGTVRYYPNTLTNGDGECYRALVSTAVVPGTDATKWLKLDFPFVLASFVKRATAADAIGDQKQNSRKRSELGLAYSDLQNAADQAIASQGQQERIEINGY